jgi:hypothetical protein
MKFSRGLFQETVHALSINWPIALTFLTATMVLQTFDKTLGNAGLAAPLILLNVLAICIHQAVIKPKLKTPIFMKLSMIWSFSWRWVAMLALCSVLCTISIYLLFWLVLTTNGRFDVFISISLIMIFFISTFVFSKWGTVLPAVAVEGDSSIASAAARGRRTFGYSAKRLFFCCGPLFIAPPVLTLFRLGKFGAMDTGVIGRPMDAGLPLLFVWLLHSLLALFGTALVATILSRAYLIGEAKENSLIA